MKRNIRIGFLGCELFNNNLGCVALSYSLLSMLSEIQEENQYIFEYYFFVRNRHGEVNLIRNILGIKNKIHVISCMDLESRDPFLRDRYFKHSLLECSLIIDLTQGDSFTDIYGQERFDLWTKEKEWVLNHKIPLVIGPQTIGPFNASNNEERAANILKKCIAVLPRDFISYQYAEEISHRTDISLTCDLAFALPYHKIDGPKDFVGINVSGLLWKDGVEKTDKHFKYKCDYREFTYELISFFTKINKNVVLIPHVLSDRYAMDEIHRSFPGTRVAEFFSDPIKAKEYISGLDFFVGARMHATIAALSSGVAVLPVAYSRKFIGLYNTLEYPYVLDLTEKGTTEIIETAIEYYSKAEQIKHIIPNSLNISKELLMVSKNRFSDIIKNLQG